MQTEELNRLTQLPNLKQSGQTCPGFSVRDCRILADSALIKGLEFSEVEMILSRASYQVLQRGDFLYQVSDRTDTFYFLLDGIMREAYNCHAGNDYLRHLVIPGHYFGLHKIFSQDMQHTHHCQAVAKSRILSWEKEPFLEYCRLNPETSLKVATLLSSAYDFSCRRKCLCQRHRAQSRVAGYLLSRCFTSHGTHDQWVDLRPLTHVAEEVNLTREAFSRTLKTMRELGLISFHKGKVLLLDVDELKKL